MRYKIKEGDIFRVPLSDGRFAFGKVLPKTWAFFDFCTKDETADLDEINLSAVAFKIWVTEFVLKKGIWKVIGNRPLSVAEKQPVFFYKQDPINNKVWKTFTGGEEEPITIEACKKLEIAAVYDPEHVIKRLDYHFAGEEAPNIIYHKKKLVDKGVATK